MLLTVSFAFIVLSGPIGVLNFFQINGPRFVFWIALTLEYINHAINSILYCISGSRFRNELRNVVFWWKRSTEPTSITERNSTQNMGQTGHIEKPYLKLGLYWSLIELMN